ncbi:Eco29kI family restriction endonuclease [Scytonema sp. UIC 10036]|uniref:Eco29kI family restriction endonuclease n=1 Tax=Scytonema sp. UIC 10036 TaxID=2304196 RepID=UPI001FA986B5|nr:Eco29kI family restriction endonuclease [Scytonema sp. UIC 10036]
MQPPRLRIGAESEEENSHFICRCSIISDFGIHAPGRGRGAQMRSMWDEIHPGRSFAVQLPANPVRSESLQPQVTQHCQNLAVRLAWTVEKR